LSSDTIRNGDRLLFVYLVSIAYIYRSEKPSGRYF
jgi:hypothetical protein